MKVKIIFIFLFCLFIDTGEIMGQITLKSASFKDGGILLKKYSNYGDNISPDLSVIDAPKNAKSAIITVEDADAAKVVGHTFVHFIGQLDPKITEIPEGQLDLKVTKKIINDSKRADYYGPRPPAGQDHGYIFTIVYLNDNFDISKYDVNYFRDTWNKQSGFYKDNKKNIIGFAQITGKYKSEE